MPVIPGVAALQDDMTAWRRHLHARPELAFEEHETSAFVAERLGEFGITVHRGLAGTGVIGTIRAGEGPAIGLRADMDALPIQEEGSISHRSQRPGVMHACGHDGHTVMLLGAARYLSENQHFRGTVHLIFQPAEELEGGAKVMVDEGLFERFPMDSVYAMHNWPSKPVGTFGVRIGPVMACCDTFELVVEGRGGHGAMPHLADDPVVVAAEIVTALQTLPSRRTDPLESLVVSVTGMMAGESYNVIPHRATLRGTVRAFRDEVRDAVEPAIRRLSDGIAAAHGVKATVDYHRRYPPTVNHAEETEAAAAAAIRIVGEAGVDRQPTPSTGAEDFSYMLEHVPGCYVWLGSGEEGGSPSLHNACYDFNDAALPIGASYWVSLVETVLAR